MAGAPQYDREPLVTEICARLAMGEPLAQICRDPHMPDRDTVYLWAEQNSDISRRIARARSLGYDTIADQCQTIADTPLIGEELTTKADGSVEVRRGDMLGHRKLQIETRLKLLAKWDPKRYGDLQKVEHSGSVDVAATLIAARKRSGLG